MVEPYSTLEDAKDRGIAEDDALLVAAELVQRWAPVPSPEPTDYEDKAAAAERLLFRYLRDTSGYVSSKSLEGAGSKSYTLGIEKLKAIVRQQMGDYFTGGLAYSVGVASSFDTNGVA